MGQVKPENNLPEGISAYLEQGLISNPVLISNEAFPNEFMQSMNNVKFSANCDFLCVFLFEKGVNFVTSAVLQLQQTLMLQLK